MACLPISMNNAVFSSGGCAHPTRHARGARSLHRHKAERSGPLASTSGHGCRAHPHKRSRPSPPARNGAGMRQSSRVPNGNPREVKCTAKASPEDSLTQKAQILIIGGTGAVGSAAAIHLLGHSEMPLQVILCGRDEGRGARRLQEVSGELGGIEAISQAGHSVEFLQLDWRNRAQLSRALAGSRVVMHTAGPYGGQKPDILEAAIAAGVPCYVDLSDPMEYIEAACQMSDAAREAGTMALLASGAFPGFSNILAMECASRLQHPVRDLSFRYFTAGLGGSGPVNLLITNQGFGEPVQIVEGGKPAPALVAGLEAEKVEFFLDKSDVSATKVGERSVWSWPFPEVATVAQTLKVSNSSTVKMGTSPDAWNVIMGWLVQVVPRSWWRNDSFSQWMADFSEPMVKFTDKFVGETHCMRIDVTDESGAVCTAVQGHDSFRRVVGQSHAEFALDLLRRTTPEALEGAWRPGVYLPEQLMTDEHREERQKLLGCLERVPGTFTYRISEPPCAGADRLVTKEL